MTTVNALGSARAVCPSWCEQPSGHPYTAENVHTHGDQERTHWIDVVGEDGISIQIEASAVAASEHAETELVGKPTITFWIDNDDHGFDGLAPIEATRLGERLADLLDEAARRLELIEGAASD